MNFKGKMHLQLLWVQYQSMRHTCGVWHSDRRRLSGGLCCVTTWSYFLSRSIKWDNWDVGSGAVSEQVRSKTLSFISLCSLSRTKDDAEHQAAAGPGQTSNPQGCSINTSCCTLLFPEASLILACAWAVAISAPILGNFAFRALSFHLGQGMHQGQSSVLLGTGASTGRDDLTLNLSCFILENVHHSAFFLISLQLAFKVCLTT